VKAWDGLITLILTLIVRLIDIWEAGKMGKAIDKARENHEEIDRNPARWMDDRGMLKPGSTKGFDRIPADVPGNEADRPPNDGA